MPGLVIDPEQNNASQPEEKRYGVLVTDEEEFALYDKKDPELYSDVRYLPAGCEVDFDIDHEKPVPDGYQSWHGIPISFMVKNLKPKPNQGHVVRRIMHLMHRYKTSMFRGVRPHPDLDNHGPDSGGYGANINHVIER